MDFLAQTTATNDLQGDLKKCNPFLKGDSVNGIICCTVLLMMTYCRISQCNLALQQCRSIMKAITSLQKAKDEQSRERACKELSALSELVAGTIVMPRYYSKSLNQGLFDVDPRFLLFEFCHGLLLRPSQVILVRKLLQDLREGRSVCNQMIMGAGKTTVVGPLLAMLLASEKSLVVEVVPC